MPREKAIGLKIFMTPTQLRRLDKAQFHRGARNGDRELIFQTVTKILFAARVARLASQPSTKD